MTREAPGFERLAETIALSELKLGRRPLRASEMHTIATMALVILTGCWVHRGLKQSLHGVDPEKRLRMLIDDLRMWPSEPEFHGRMSDIFASLRDLHTTYVLPRPYRRRVAFLPFMLEECEGATFVVSKVHASVRDLQPGATVTHWNGIPIERAVELNAARRAGSNRSAQRARGLESLTFRWLGTSPRPDEDWVTLTVKQRGRTQSVTFPWWVALRDERGPTGDNAAGRSLALGLDEESEWIRELKATLFGHATDRGASRWLPGVLRSAVVPDPGGDFGYLRIFTFAVENEDLLVREVERIVAELPRRGLILDVRGNGGGSIVAAERLLQLFTERKIAPHPLRFLNSDLTERMVTDHTELVPDGPDFVDSMAMLRRTGAPLSPPMWLTSPEACNNIGQRYTGPVVLLVDALSYSATDVFAAGFEAHEIGQVIGTSRFTGGGGANVWGYETLRILLQDKFDPRLKPLPFEASFTVAVRSISRVGADEAFPLEDLGVLAEYRAPTRADILDGNRDLIAAAVAALKRGPLEQEEEEEESSSPSPTPSPPSSSLPPRPAIRRRRERPRARRPAAWRLRGALRRRAGRARGRAASVRGTPTGGGRAPR